MFTPIEIDLTEKLSAKNEMKIIIKPHPKSSSGVKNTRQEADRSVKPPVSYGWDWHPRLLTSGLWEEAYFETRHQPKIIVEYSYEIADDYESCDLSFMHRMDKKYITEQNIY